MDKTKLCTILDFMGKNCFIRLDNPGLWQWVTLINSKYGDKYITFIELDAVNRVVTQHSPATVNKKMDWILTKIDRQILQISAGGNTMRNNVIHSRIAKVFQALNQFSDTDWTSEQIDDVVYHAFLYHPGVYLTDTEKAVIIAALKISKTKDITDDIILAACEGIATTAVTEYARIPD